MGGGAKPAVAAPAPPPGPGRSAELIPEVRHTIAVSSGKGGVGKSTVAVNLAVALSQMGAAVGIIDSDVYGPDVPLMLGARGRPGMFENRIIPVEAHGMKMMSIGLLVSDREPLVWRGPMIHSFIQQMLKDVSRSEEHTSELQSRLHLVCRLLLEKKNTREERSR